MPKFALYFIPPARGEQADLYRRGTGILGYNIRTGKTSKPGKSLREEFGEFEDHWVAKAAPYGFHVTITDSIDFHPADIKAIEHEIEDILNCFKPEHRFLLTKHASKFIDTFGDSIVLRYSVNKHLNLFEAVAVARLNPRPLGLSSRRLADDLLAKPKRFAREPVKHHRMTKFCSETIFDSYTAHFTVLRPYRGGRKRDLRAALGKMFGEFEEVEVSSVCLLVKPDNDDIWRVYREFQRSDYPQPIR